jgi:ribosomal protein S20
VVTVSLPVVHTPVALAPEPRAVQRVEVPPPQDNEVDLDTPVAVAAASPKRERRRTVRPVKDAEQPAPAQVATSEEPADVAAIGELTAGGDAGPQTRQMAADLIKENDKRLEDLPSTVQHTMRSQLSKIKNFQRQAKQAMSSGDAEGAKTLATKAKLLLDDLDKPTVGG